MFQCRLPVLLQILLAWAVVQPQAVLAQFARPSWSVVPAPNPQSRPRGLLADAPPLEPIQPLTATVKPWPSPSLNPGVPSAFVANWGDVFVAGSAATQGNERPDADGSWVAGFGLGDASRAIALELSGGCGSVKNFCSNGSFGARVSRLLINQPRARLALAGGWQNGVQWGNEGRQDNVYSATLTYAIPLRPGTSFPQTFQINAGVGNSSFAPYVDTGSESQVGGFGSVGVELTPALGVSAGWSGRGVNAQLSYSPLRDVPISLNLLGADLLNQTPAGTVGVLTIGWGTNFTTPAFQP